MKGCGVCRQELVCMLACVCRVHVHACMFAGVCVCVCMCVCVWHSPEASQKPAAAAGR